MNTDNKTEQTKGVIEGLEQAAKSHADEYYDENDESESSISEHDKWENRKYNFIDGAKWHHDTHYMPLLELCVELNKALEAAKDCMMEESPSDEILEKHGCDNYGWINLTVNRAIEKANNYLKQ